MQRMLLMLRSRACGRAAGRVLLHNDIAQKLQHSGRVSGIAASQPACAASRKNAHPKGYCAIGAAAVCTMCSTLQAWVNLSGGHAVARARGAIVCGQIDAMTGTADPLD